MWYYTLSKSLILIPLTNSVFLWIMIDTMYISNDFKLDVNHTPITSNKIEFGFFELVLEKLIDNLQFHGFFIRFLIRKKNQIESKIDELISAYAWVMHSSNINPFLQWPSSLSCFGESSKILLVTHVGLDRYLYNFFNCIR